MNQIGDIPPVGKSTLKYSDIFKKNAFKEKHITQINTTPTEQTKKHTTKPTQQQTTKQKHNTWTTSKNILCGTTTYIFNGVFHIYY